MARNNEKYSRAVLAPAVLASSSVAGVLRYLGLKQAGGSHAHIARRIVAHGLDTSHFTGRATNRGSERKGGSQRKPPHLVLVKRERGARQNAVRLRRAMIESGVPYRCASCGGDAVWRGRPLVLQVEHKNRNWLDDRLENLEFLCPNCHSQTKGWCGSKGGTDIMSTARQERNRRVAKRQTRQT